MANQKISELTALLGSNVADDDALAIVDTSTTQTKKINFSEFKLAFSDGIYLGGTGSANLLNDYEEGTFTPVFADASSGGNEASADTANGYYTKIGRQVYISFVLTNINTSGLTSNTTIFITGLPFSAVSLTGDIRYSGTYTVTNTSVVGSDIINVAEIRDNNNYLRFRQSTSGDFLTVGEITSGSTDFYVSLTYFA